MGHAKVWTSVEVRVVDYSFRALVLSLVVHALFTLLFLRVPSQIETRGRNVPIEIRLDEPKQKRRQIVTETQKQDLNPVDKLKKEADYLAQFTKRVKEQLRARNTGATKNRTGQIPQESDEARAKGTGGLGADARVARQLTLPPGVGPQMTKSGEGSSPFGRQVVVGASTTGEFIRGVKEGAFTALNTDRFTFYTFFARINEQVRPRWESNLRSFAAGLSTSALTELGTRDRVTEIDIQIDRQGQFQRAIVMRTSGYRGLDESATEAFRDAAPFLNPPAEMADEDGLIHLNYGFIVQWEPTHLANGR